MPDAATASQPVDLSIIVVSYNTRELTLGCLDALFAEVNNLPADDPLRGKGNGQQPVPSAASELTSATEQAQAAPPLAEKTPPVMNNIFFSSPGFIFWTAW